MTEKSDAKAAEQASAEKTKTQPRKTHYVGETGCILDGKEYAAGDRIVMTDDEVVAHRNAGISILDEDPNKG
jgi:hypothetical protein